MQYATALQIIGGLSAPSKMPWWGWSTSAFDCKTGSKLRQVKGSTCSACYALKGNYRFKNVKAAHDRRLLALEDPRFVEAFIVVLNSLYDKSRSTYIKNGERIKENRFRWHDSGDLQSLRHLEMINQIALGTLRIDHWLPTREYGIVSSFLKSHPKEGFAPNLLVRMSALMVGEISKSTLPLPFSTVGVGEGGQISQCPAYNQGGKCLDCRNCWDKENQIVNYPKH